MGFLNKFYLLIFPVFIFLYSKNDINSLFISSLILSVAFLVLSYLFKSSFFRIPWHSLKSKFFWKNYNLWIYLIEAIVCLFFLFGILYSRGIFEFSLLPLSVRMQIICLISYFIIYILNAYLLKSSKIKTNIFFSIIEYVSVSILSFNLSLTPIFLKNTQSTTLLSIISVLFSIYLISNVILFLYFKGKIQYKFLILKKKEKYLSISSLSFALSALYPFLASCLFSIYLHSHNVLLLVLVIPLHFILINSTFLTYPPKHFVFKKICFLLFPLFLMALTYILIVF